jgi:signal transduction histidine kinase
LQIVSWGAPPSPSSSAGIDVTETASQDDPRGGLGLTIVRWIASEHRGMLTYQRDGERNIYQLALPAIASDLPPS